MKKQIVPLALLVLLAFVFSFRYSPPRSVGPSSFMRIDRWTGTAWLLTRTKEEPYIKVLAEPLPIMQQPSDPSSPDYKYVSPRQRRFSWEEDENLPEPSKSYEKQSIDKAWLIRKSLGYIWLALTAATGIWLLIVLRDNKKANV